MLFLSLNMSDYCQKRNKCHLDFLVKYSQEVV